ncbi:MAG: hypothetical protein ACI8Y8_003578, partial [Planctomycetota bacterium]
RTSRPGPGPLLIGPRLHRLARPHPRRPPRPAFIPRSRRPHLAPKPGLAPPRPDLRHRRLARLISTAPWLPPRRAAAPPRPRAPMMASSHPGTPPSPALPRHRQRRDTPLGAPSLAVTGQGGASPRFAPEPEAEGTLPISISLSPSPSPHPSPPPPAIPPFPEIPTPRIRIPNRHPGPGYPPNPQSQPPSSNPTPPCPSSARTVSGSPPSA